MAVIASAGEAAAAITAGATVLQLRAPDLTARRLVREASALVAAAGGRPVLVSSRVDVALAAGAAGVHLPERDLSCGAARRLLGPGAVVGRSVHSAQPAQPAPEDADYLLFGPVWETASHPGRPAAGLLALAEACRAAAPVPVLAIGGVTTPDRVTAALAAGAAGHASISGFRPAPGR